MERVGGASICDAQGMRCTGQGGKGGKGSGRAIIAEPWHAILRRVAEPWHAILRRVAEPWHAILRRVALRTFKMTGLGFTGTTFVVEGTFAEADFLPQAAPFFVAAPFCCFFLFMLSRCFEGG
jgi:hypothetical protein